jgi:hypothetical protein
VEFCCADTNTDADAVVCCFSLLGPRDVPKINMDQRAGHVASGGVARRRAEQEERGEERRGEESCGLRWQKMKLDRGAASAMTEQI